MKLLAFETATEACSVALYLDGEVHERFDIAPRRHAELSLPWADALLAEAGLARSQLAAIAVGRGPGAFTGVRLGIAIAQGIALALDCPLLPVSTLETLALRAPDVAPQVLACIDARMGEVYAAGYAWAPATGWQALADAAVLPPEAVAVPPAGTLLAGNAAAVYAERLPAAVLALPRAEVLPTADALLNLAPALLAAGRAVPADQALPLYIRDKVAQTTAERAAAGLAR